MYQRLRNVGCNYASAKRYSTREWISSRSRLIDEENQGLWYNWKDSTETFGRLDQFELEEEEFAFGEQYYVGIRAVTKTGEVDSTVASFNPLEPFVRPFDTVREWGSGLVRSPIL